MVRVWPNIQKNIYLASSWIRWWNVFAFSIARRSCVWIVSHCRRVAAFVFLFLVAFVCFATEENSEDYSDPLRHPRYSGQLDLQLTADETAWVTQHPVIDIGVDGGWPPIDFIDNSGRHSGIAASYIRLIEERLNIRFKIHPGPTFKGMLEKVRAGHLKVGATIVENEERAKDLVFSKSFFEARRVIVARRNAYQYQTIKELSGKTVAIETDFSTAKQLSSSYPEIKLIYFDSTLDALKAVSWEQADAYVGNQLVIHWLIQQEQLSNLKISGGTGLSPSLQRFAVYREQHWLPFVEILNKVLASITDKERRSITQSWIRTEDSEIALKLDLTPKHSDP